MKQYIIYFYCIFLFLVVLFSYLFIDNNFSYLHFLYTGFYTQYRLWVTLLFLFFLSIFFLLYIFFLRLENNNMLPLKTIKYLILATCFAGIFAYPAMLSYDIFNYVATAKVTYLYKENPYIVMPIDIKNDQDFIFTRATNKVALYGPFWILLTAIPYVVGFGNYLLTLFTMKLLVITFYLATFFIIWKITKDKRSVVFFALNPLVIFEVIISGHNDIVMMFLALSSLYLFMKKRVFLSFFAFFFSIFIKYATLLLSPLVAFAMYKVMRGEKIDWEKYIKISVLLMGCMFLLSAFREEIYPWYALWFLSFVSLLPKNKILIYFSIIISGSLLLRYVPFMLFGTYFGLTPYLKIVFGFLPPFLFIVYVLFFRRIWLKNIFR